MTDKYRFANCDRPKQSIGPLDSEPKNYVCETVFVQQCAKNKSKGGKKKPKVLIAVPNRSDEKYAMGHDGIVQMGIMAHTF